MNATPFEFRFRYILHVLIYVLGFTAPWDRLWLHGSEQSVWLAIAALCARQGWLSLFAAAIALTSIAIACAWAGALLRTWGTSYLGASIVKDSSLHAGPTDTAILAAGPYRHLRNPLYLGTFIHTLALALIMPASGAIVTILLIGILQLRLIFSEEKYLLTQLGPAYTAYREGVPRLLPSITPRIPASGQSPNWLQGALAELYPLGVAIGFSIFAWRYNSLLLIQCVVVSFGASLLARAIAPSNK